LTINRKDFIDLHKNYHEAGATHAGIIVCTKDDDFKRLATKYPSCHPSRISSCGYAAESVQKYMTKVHDCCETLLNAYKPYTFSLGSVFLFLLCTLLASEMLSISKF